MVPPETIRGEYIKKEPPQNAVDTGGTAVLQ